MTPSSVGSGRRESMRLRIGKNLARLREAAGLSVERCAKRVGVSRWSWMRYEDGGQIPLELLPSICTVLTSTVDDIFPAGHRPSITPAKRAA